MDESRLLTDEEFADYVTDPREGMPKNNGTYLNTNAAN